MTQPSISILTVFSLWMIVRIVFAQDLTSAQSDKTEETPPELQVMSFNIRYGTADDGQNSWKNRRHIVFDVIQNSHPDILCLQEDLRFQIEEIMQNAGLAVDLQSPIPTNEEFSELGLDSLDVFNIFIELESQAGIQVPDSDIEKLQTIDNIHAYLAARDS